MPKHESVNPLPQGAKTIGPDVQLSDGLAWIKSRLSGGIDGPHVLQIILHEYYCLPWGFMTASSRQLEFMFPSKGMECCQHKTARILQKSTKWAAALASSCEIKWPHQGPYLIRLPFPHHPQVGHKYKVVDEKLRTPSPSHAPGIWNTRKNPFETLVQFQEDLKKRT